MSQLEKVFDHYGYEFNGQNKTCCPVHGEKTPSFTYYPDSDSFYCFGCNISGDAIQLIREVEGCDFKQAVSLLEEILGEKVEVGKGVKKERSEKLTEAPALPMEVLKEIASTTEYQNVGYRGIRKETDEYFKVRSVVDGGKVTRRYYPETNDDGAITGMKCRNTPKDFSHGKVGVTGVKSQ